MKALEEKILNNGVAIGTEIVKVDNFLNHQIDVRFLEEIGAEFARLFEKNKPNKILTVEASGIAIAFAVSPKMDYKPVVFAKKTSPNTMVGDFYSAEAKSFTKGTVSQLRVSKDFISEGDRVLIVDDFLARGEAGVALVNIVRMAGAEVVGFGAVIEKKFQGGAQKLRDMGVEVHSLAVVEKIEDGVITFGIDPEQLEKLFTEI